MWHETCVRIILYYLKLFFFCEEKWSLWLKTMLYANLPRACMLISVKKKWTCGVFTIYFLSGIIIIEIMRWVIIFLKHILLLILIRGPKLKRDTTVSIEIWHPNNNGNLMFPKISKLKLSMKAKKNHISLVSQNVWCHFFPQQTLIHMHTREISLLKNFLLVL